MQRVTGGPKVLIVAGAVFLGAGPAHAQTLYWNDSQPTRRILSAQPDGSGVQIVVANPTERPVHVTLDPAGGKMYWLDRESGLIQRANLDGSSVEDLVSTRFSGFSSATPPALDPAGGKMYWTDFLRGGLVQRANLDGSQVEPLLIRTGTLISSEALAVDPGARKLYWCDANRIQRANLDGSAVEVLVVAATPLAADLTLDLAGGKMYWSTSGGTIQRAGLDGSSVEDLVLGHSSSAPIALDRAHGKMFWREADRIRRANLDGTAVEDVVTALFPLFSESGLAVDSAGGKVYWIEQVLSLETPYKIRRANLDGSSAEDVVTDGLRFPDHLALSPLDGKIYWADLDLSEIHRADFDGGRREAVVVRRLGAVSAMAADPAARKVYWADFATGQILRANRDGSEVEAAVSTGPRQVTALAVDPTEGKLYWALDPPQFFGGTLRRSNRDGSNVEDLVTTRFRVEGLALDVAARRMYWTDGSDIRRASLDGSGVVDLIVGAKASGPIVVDPVLGKVYWASGPPVTDPRAIRRANLDGSQVETAIPFTTPAQMAIDLVGHALYHMPIGGEFGGGRPTIFRADPLRGSSQVAELLGAGGPIAFEASVAPMAATGFATSAPGNGLDSFLRVSEGLPTAAGVGPIGSPQAAVKDVDVDPTSGRIYTIDLVPDGQGQQVFVVDPVTGAGTPLPQRTGLAPPALVWGLAFDAAGTLYGGGMGVYVIDKQTGRASLRAGVDRVPALIFGMAASPDGVGFLSSGLLLAPGQAVPYLGRHGADGAFVPGGVVALIDPQGQGRVLFDIALASSGFLYGNAWPASLFQSARQAAGVSGAKTADTAGQITRLLQAPAAAGAHSDLVLVYLAATQNTPVAAMTSGAPLPALLLGLGRTRGDSAAGAK